MPNLTTQNVTGIFDLDTSRLIGLAPKGVADPTFFPTSDVQMPTGSSPVLANSSGQLVTPDGKPAGDTYIQTAISAAEFAPEPVMVGCEELVLLVGTRTLSTVNNLPTLSLIDGVNTGFTAVPQLLSDVGYEVYVWLSSSSDGSGLHVYCGFDAATCVEGAVIPAGSTKYAGLSLSLAGANVPVRYQLPVGVLKTSNTRGVIYVRFDRRGGDTRDTYAGTLQLHGIEFVPAGRVVDGATDKGSVSASVFKTPYDGESVSRGLAIYTPIWTAPAGILVCEPVTRAAVQQSRVALLNRTSKATISDTQIGAVAHDSIIGHRDSSVCIDASGKYIVHGETHHAAWIGKYGTDLAALAAIAAPAGVSSQSSYRKFFRNPYDGSIWLGMRGDTYYGGIYKWNGTGFDRMGGSMIGGNGNDPGFVGYYGMELAFASATTIYATVEPIRVPSGAGLSGYPRQNIGVIKSTDGGTTWVSMAGNPLALPLTPGGDADIAFPTYNNLHTTVAGRIAVASDGRPVVVAAWKHPSETLRGTWAAKWDGARWIRSRLLASNGQYSAGNPHVCYLQNGTIFATASWEDDHDNGSSADGGASTERAPSAGPVYLFKSTNGVTWSRYTITGVADGGYGGAYLDPEAPRLDGVLRLLPRRETDPTASEFWEIAIPA